MEGKGQVVVVVVSTDKNGR